MIELFNGSTGERIADLTEEQFDSLIDCLADDAGTERFTIDKDLLTYLRDRKVRADVVSLLEKTLGKDKSFVLEYHIHDELDIRFGAEEE